MSDVIQLPGEIITEIEMSNTYSIWLILEGYSDEKLFLSKTFSKEIKAVVAFGWENVTEIIHGCDGMVAKTVIGLIDRDYRDLNNTQPVHNNIIMTDYHDIENILFESKALEKVYCEYGSINKMPKHKSGKINYEEIRKELSDVAYKLGMFRAYCFANGFNISFKLIDHTKFISDRDLSINEKKLITHLAGKQENRESVLRIEWKKTQGNWVPDNLSSPVYIRHGHDLMSVIAISFRRKWGSKGGALTREDVEAYFRIATEEEEIKKYDFWKRIEEKISAI